MILRCEGEYLNDEMWNIKGYDLKNNIISQLKEGKGFLKEYNKDGIIFFEGEYLNGKRNGKGKEYKDEDLIYEGHYLNGKRDGKGKEYDDVFGKLIFEREYLYNHRRKGKEYVNEKLEYKGDYLYDKKWNGKGYDSNGNIIYELINGKGNVKEYTIYGI